MISARRDGYRGPDAPDGVARPPARAGRYIDGIAFAGSVDVDEIRRDRAPVATTYAGNAANVMHAVNAMNAMNAMNAVNAVNAVNVLNAGQVAGHRDGPARPAGPVRLLQVAGCLVVEVGRSDVRRAAAIARRLPTESHRLSVVVAAPLQAIVPELAEQLQPWVWAGWRSVRLVGARAGAPGDDVAFAHELAEQLGVEVVAPDGGLMAVPDGSLFVIGGQASAHGRGAWWKFNPGESPVRAGSRYPPTAWEADLAEFTDPGIGGVVVDEVPAGLWIHRSGTVQRTDLAYAVSPDPRRVKVLVSRPGDEPLPAAHVRHAVLALPPGVRDRMVVVAYGDRPVTEDRLGAVVAAATRHTVRVGTSLTLPLSRGRSQVVAIDEDGALAWRPFVREVAWHPRGGPPQALKWSDPFGDLRSVGPAQYELNRQWVVELVECGLWIRPAAGFGGAELVRELPLDGGQCTVVVSPPERRWLRPPWRQVARLMRRLPADARARVTLAVLEDAGEAVAVAAARACAGVLAGRPVRLLGHDGTMEPRFVALPVNRLQELVGWPGAVLRIVEQPPDTSAVGHPRRPAAAERLPEHFADRFDAYVTEQFPVHVGEHVTQASDESGFARGVPAGGIRSYVDQLRRVPAPAWHTDRGGGQRIEDAEPVGAAGGVGARGDLPHPPRPVQPAAVSGWASAPGRGGDPPRQRAQRVDQVRPGEVPEWDEVLRRQSRTDLRGPRDLDDVSSGPARPDRYGVTPPESAQLVGTRPAGRHRAEPTGDDGWADDEPEAMRADRDWRRPDTS